MNKERKVTITGGKNKGMPGKIVFDKKPWYVVNSKDQLGNLILSIVHESLIKFD